jgi:hypothetical protein
MVRHQVSQGVAVCQSAATTLMVRYCAVESIDVLARASFDHFNWLV